MRFVVALSLAVFLVEPAVQGQDTASCVEYGDTAALSCDITLTGGLTLRTLQWTKDGLAPGAFVADYLLGTVTPGTGYTGRATINDTGFLLLQNVQQADEGMYKCKSVSLSDASALPEVDTLMGKEGPPTQVSCTNNITVNETDKVILNCTADLGCPLGQSSWVQMPTSDQVNSSDGTLIISNVTKGHDGTFMCAASNTLGRGECQTVVRVQFNPEVTDIPPSPPEEVDLLYGSGRLTAPPVDAFPQAKIIWRKKVTQEEVKRSYETHHDVIFAWSNAGTYTCTAENLLGSTPCGEFEVKMTVWRLVLVIVIPLVVVITAIVAVAVIYCKKTKVLPKAPAEIKLQPVPSSQKMLMQWTAESKGSYKIQYRPRGSDDWTNLDVSASSHPYYKHTVDFQRDGDYEVCVLVTNAKGETKSAIKEATVKASKHPGETDSLVSPLHGNKTDVPLVFMISEGQSHPPMKHKLDPIEIKQNPTEKKSKKKKKRKKLNEVHASDEDLKPPEG